MSKNPTGNAPEIVTGPTGPSDPSSAGGGAGNPIPKTTTPGMSRQNSRLWRRKVIPQVLVEKIPAARLAFSQLQFKDLKPEMGDLFFQVHCPGNTVNIIDRPYERFLAYESLLEDLNKDNLSIYRIIHKGTPFYFLGWTAFLMGDYEKAVFYMDAAISEDMKNYPNDWQKMPAGESLILGDVEDQLAKVITLELIGQLEEQFVRFNNIPERNKKKGLTIKEFRDGFITPFLKKTNARSVLTAFYSFIAEYNDRQLMINLRSEYGGSIEPFLIHLFKGGLIFESLIRIENPKISDKDKKGRPCTPRGLEVYFQDPTFKTDYDINGIENDSPSLKTITDILNYCKNATSPIKAFRAVQGLRNFTGHTLARIDEFKIPGDYALLYHQVLNALLYVIAKKLDKI